MCPLISGLARHEAPSKPSLPRAGDAYSQTAPVQCTPDADAPTVRPPQDRALGVREAEAEAAAAQEMNDGLCQFPGNFI